MELLEDCISNPAVKCGWGMDYVWAYRLRYERIGIIDAYESLCAAFAFNTVLTL
jgi:hypothetical protein